MKYLVSISGSITIKVAPSWECGLKLIAILKVQVLFSVAPSWECGLKSGDCAEKADTGKCRSLVGVWIEMHLMVYCQFLCKRRSLVGVWIEISMLSFCCVHDSVAPSWECGLKFDKFEKIAQLCVAPSWECGLKYRLSSHHDMSCLSLPRGSVD